MTSTNSRTALDKDKLYSAWDRIVCGRIRCAGACAVSTGHTIGGAQVLPLTAREAREHHEAGFRVECECGAVNAGPILHY